MKSKKMIYKIIASFICINLLAEIFIPTVAFALTAGPASPEFASFEPVATTDMVNVFTGDFNYNLPVVDIPGPDGGGYALSLSYHSGSNIEEEASWVGFGWTLNPGAVNRGVNGFPDDYNGTTVTYYNKVRPNWTISAGAEVSFEAFGKKEVSNQSSDPDLSLNLSLAKSIRFNNYLGMQKTFSTNLSYGGMASIGMQESASGITFSADINPLGILNNSLKFGGDNSAFSKAYSNSSCSGERRLKKLMKSMDHYSKYSNLSLAGSGYGLFTYAQGTTNTAVSDMKSINFNYSSSIRIDPFFIPSGISTGFTGSFSLQRNTPSIDRKGYGYIHNKNTGDENTMFDYSVEKAGNFEKRDLFIGMPFNSADNFVCTGEGLIGGFRAFQPEAGHYYSNRPSMESDIYNIGYQIVLGTDVGIGVSVGIGKNKTEIADWKKINGLENYQFNETNWTNAIFKFSGDMGGNIEYGSNEKNFATIGKKKTLNFDANAVSGSFLTGVNSSLEANKNTGRSSYIDPHYSDYLLNGFGIVNENGTNYYYGNKEEDSEGNHILLSKREANISTNVPIESTNIENNFISYDPLRLRMNTEGNYFIDTDNEENKTIIGEIKNEPFVNTFLINEITSANYIDADGIEGASKNDFGGWTQFDYHKTYSFDDNQITGGYNYRAPYIGQYYQKNQLSDLTDDIQTANTGQKEVSYLKKIETKTHIAYFVTNKTGHEVINRFQDDLDVLSNNYPELENLLKGSGKNRYDGYSAFPVNEENNLAAEKRPEQISSTDFSNSKSLEYLEKVIIFSKDRYDRPIKTVHFQYNYGLAKGLPNNINTNYQHDNSGKLTLEKVWIEYEGVYKAKISPYVFSYEYKKGSEFPAGFLNENDLFFSNYTSENPDYKPYLLDPWSDIQYDSKNRHEKMQYWNYQGTIEEPSAAPDPGAWQLKQIKLPSGSEILIEYEQKDYQYVQDRKAMALASILEFDDWENNKIKKEPYYIINTEDLGCSNDVLQEYKDELYKYFVLEKNLVYFKFLFKLIGSGDADLNDCKSEYIDGYARVLNVELLNGNTNIKITIDGNGSGYDDENPESEGYAMVPRQGCFDFCANNRFGKIEYNNCINPLEIDLINPISSLIGGNSNIVSAASGVINVIKNLKDVTLQNITKSSICLKMNIDLSYLKLPLPNKKAKLGGGCRVKKLFVYDSGLENSNGDAVIYGNEYLYKLKDGSSSGVARNEPASIREENALVGFLPREIQSWLSRNIVGKDKEQSEGPLGETILPIASVGHSRVVIKNIHTGRTGNGYSVQTFYTDFDYPYDYYYQNIDAEKKYDLSEVKGMEYTSLNDDDHFDKSSFPLMTGIFNLITKKLWATQGFSFIKNQMNGQLKSISNYYGDYTILQNGSEYEGIESSSTTYTFYEPGEKVKMLKNDGTYYWNVPGKEMDVTMEGKNLKDYTFDLAIDLDATIPLMLPINVTVSVFPRISISDKQLSTHATTKIINYPVILKSVENQKEGIKSRVENLAFDPSTGKAILTRTTDSYHKISIDNSNSDLVHDGSYYNLNLPAHWYYNTMGQRRADPNNSNQLNASAGNIVTYGAGGNFIQEAGQTDNGGVWKIPSNRIVDINIQTYAKSSAITSWFDQMIQNEYAINGASLTALGNFWRPFSNYTYKQSTTTSSKITDATERVFERGIYTNFTPYNDPGITGDEYLPFNFADENSNPNWTRISTATKYSPHGSVLEEKDALNLYSAVKYGYKFTQPIMVAKNARYGSIVFLDFESNDLAQTGGHSGNKSMGVGSGNSFTITDALQATLLNSDHLIEKGAIAKVWIKKSDLNTDISEKDIKLILSSNATEYESKKVAQTGEWTLYSFTIPSGAIQEGNFGITLKNSTSQDISIDDFRFQPLDAAANCYVYDASTLRLVAQFDDQHFGVYYQYNGEGMLVRKMIETEKGFKTIQENQYNKPSVVRVP
jgi:hypothetical protein